MLAAAVAGDDHGAHVPQRRAVLDSRQLPHGEQEVALPHLVPLA